jgi:hypothetical protein
MKWPRRLWRIAMLTLRWARYLVTAGSARFAFQDLVTWVRTGVLRRDLADLGLPWFTLPAARFLDGEISQGMEVFEWGSGASTLFFARRGCRVTSAEHDVTWAARTRVRVAAHPHVHVREFAGPDEAYVGAIDSAPAGSLDMVVVDGRRRCDCFMRALSRVKPGGWLILDDSERPAYRSCLDLAKAEEWEVRHFPGPRAGTIWPVFGRTSCLRRLPAT